MAGLVLSTSSTDVASTAGAIRAELERRGVPLFGTVDHGANAKGAGLELPDEVVLIFGNPAVGTHLMQEDPTVGIELPLRILVWDDGGTTKVGYHDPRELAQSYELGQQAQSLAAMAGLLEALVGVVS